jgi:DNA-binding transcriptional ArsR family regulator
LHLEVIIVAVRNDLDELLSVLAEPTRRLVIQLLADGPQRASDLAASTAVTPSAMSRHLKVLRDHGLVDVELSSGDARERNYQLRGAELTTLTAWVDQVQAGLEEQLAAFKRHVETPSPAKRSGR